MKFELVTVVTDADFYAYNIKNQEFTNKVDLSAKTNVAESPITCDATAKQKLNSEVISKSCLGYDYATQVFTWSIMVNDHQIPMENVQVEDVIPQEQDYIAGSASVTRIIGDKDSSPIALDVSYSNDKMLNMQLGEIGGKVQDKYEICYTTKLNADDVDLNLKDNTQGDTRVIENEATLKRDTYTNVTGSAKKTIQNVLLNKEAGAINKTDGNVTFTLKLNQNRTLLKNAVVTDVLSAGLLLDAFSIQLSTATIDATGTFAANQVVDAANYSFTYDAEAGKLQVMLPQDTTEAYILSYKADIVDATQPLTNSASLGVEGVENTESASVTLDQSAAGAAAGNARQKKGKISIKKVDAISKDALEDTKFGLYDEAGNLLQEEMTDALGELTFAYLAIGQTYVVKEIAASPHYITDTTSAYEFTVVDKDMVNYEGDNIAILPDIENARSADWEVVFTVTDESGNPIQGGLFGVYDENGVEITTAYSDENGVVTISVPFGSYTIKQISAPAGFTKSAEVLTVSIDSTDPVDVAPILKDEQGQPVTVFVDTKIPKKDIAFILTDASGARLQGGVFGLYDASGNEVAKATSDADGTVVFTAPVGTYTIKQISAPEGYIASELVITVTITGAEAEDAILLGGFVNLQINKESPIVSPEKEPLGKTPATGDKNTLSVLMAGILITLLAAGILIYIKRRAKE